MLSNVWQLQQHVFRNDSPVEDAEEVEEIMVYTPAPAERTRFKEKKRETLSATPSKGQKFPDVCYVIFLRPDIPRSIFANRFFRLYFGSLMNL